MPAALKRKIGGLPVWAWISLIAGAIVLGLFLRNRIPQSRGGADADTASQLDTFFPSRSNEADPIPGTVGGGPGGGGIGQTVDPPEPPPVPIPISIPTFIPIETPVLGGGGASEVLPPRIVETPIAIPISIGGAASVTPSPVPTPGPIPGKTFVWVFAATTFRGERLPAKAVWGMNDRPLFMKHLGARGLTYAGWRNGHRKAACEVFGDC